MDLSLPENHPLNINSSSFDSDAFVSNLIQKKSLDELVAVEEDMVQNVRRLDSEMQQLVYENYNKFLTATATVRSMQTAFTEMDNEVQGLSEKVRAIGELSDSLTDVFGKNRETLRKLTDNSKTIQRLQYFVKLPRILQDAIDRRNYRKAVEIYVNVKPKLEKYKDTKAMSGIYTDCKRLMEDLEQQLQKTLVAKVFSADDVVEAAQLLRKFGTADVEIRAKLLAYWDAQIAGELANLQTQVDDAQTEHPEVEHSSPTSGDVLDFVDRGCCTFLTNLSLYVSVFVQLFKRQENKVELMHLVEKSMRSFETLLLQRFAAEKNSRNCALFVRALDRISRKIAVFSRILPGMDVSRMNSAIVVGAAEHEIKLCRNGVRHSIETELHELLNSLANDSLIAGDSTDTATTAGDILHSLAAKIEQAFLVFVKTSLANLLLFKASDMNFNNIDAVYFGAIGMFSVHVFENVIVGALADLSDLASNCRVIFADALAKNSDAAAEFFLIFAAFLHTLRTKHVGYLVDLSQEQFRLIELKIVNKSSIQLTPLDAMTKELRTSMTELLRYYTEAECTLLDAVTAMSFKQFDWSQVNEPPRTVRTLAEHFLQCLVATNLKICQLTGEKIEPRVELPTDSSAPSSAMRWATSVASSTLANNYETISLGGSSVDAGGAVGIMEKLWSDKPDADPALNFLLDCSGSADTNRTPPTVAQLAAAVVGPTFDFRARHIVSAVIRICLRRVADCLASTKFSTFGLQQLQLDCVYLRGQLLDLPIDEHMLGTLIDDCVGAAVAQCAEPRLLEPTIVRAICERH